MRAGFVIMGEVWGQDASEMLLVEHDDMIKTVATDRSEDPLSIRAVPTGTAKRMDARSGIVAG